MSEVLVLDTALWIGIALSYVLGTFFAIDALWQGRTSQSTIAWFLGLVFLPFFTLPLYALFGGRRFHGYIRARRHGHEELDLLRSEERRVGKECRSRLSPVQ